MTNETITKPSKQGKFIFEGIQEGKGEERKTMIFSPPLVVEFSIYEKNENTNRDNFSETTSRLAYVNYDFGMSMETSVDESNWLINGYEGLSKESDPVDILMYSLIFDLFHSFCHNSQDPNYTHYNFALAGWLKDRVVVHTYETKEEEDAE